MSKLTYKVSYYVLYAMFALIVIVLGLFYFGGQMETPIVYDMDNPANTDALLYLMYGLFWHCCSCNCGCCYLPVRFCFER